MSKFEINSIVWCIFKGGLQNTSYPKTGLCNSKYLDYLCKNPIYEFDMGIIDEKSKDGFYVTLGSGIQIYLDTTNIIGDYYNVDELDDGQYFGRNTRYIKKYDKDANKWKPFVLSDDDLKTDIFSTYLKQLEDYDDQIKKIYTKLFFSYKISNLNALDSFIYKLPLLPKSCAEPSDEDDQKYKTNSVVLIRPTMGYRDFDYEFVVAIILDYVPDINNYIVSTFESGVLMLIKENQIIEHIRCPDDGDYFGFFINRTKRFNSTTNTWENVDDSQIENNEPEFTKFVHYKNIFRELQSKQPPLTQEAMENYRNIDGERISYLKERARDSIERGAETAGSVFNYFGLGRVADGIDTAKTFFQPVKNLAYNVASDLYNYKENAEKNEILRQRDERIRQKLEQNKTNLNKTEGGSKTKSIKMNKFIIKRKSHRHKQMRKTSNKQSRNLGRKKSRKI